jgi:hypothetical protein
MFLYTTFVTASTAAHQCFLYTTFVIASTAAHPNKNISRKTFNGADI